MDDGSLFNIYMEKQRKFIAMIKGVQYSFNSKEYQSQGYSFKEFSRMKWNISQAQAYRYIMCAKVIDQLDEFEIKPSYESLCKSLNDYAKTPIQMKLLWSRILQKTNNRPDCINSTHINQYWRELCMDEKYSNICHYEDQDEIMERIEQSLNKFSKEKKQNSKEINQTKQNKKIKQQQKMNNSNTNSYQFSDLSDSSSNSVNINMQFSSINSQVYNNPNNNKIIYSSLSSINDASSNSSVSIPNNENLINNSSYVQYIPCTIPVYDPSTQMIYYVPNENELSNQYQQQSLNQITYFQKHP